MTLNNSCFMMFYGFCYHLFSEKILGFLCIIDNFCCSFWVLCLIVTLMKSKMGTQTIQIRNSTNLLILQHKGYDAVLLQNLVVFYFCFVFAANFCYFMACIG